MLARELFNLRSILQKEGIIFAYSGYLTEAVLSGVGEAVKHKLALEDTDTKTQRSVFAVFVEQVQNMIRYSAEKIPSSEMRYGVLTIGREGDDYVVHAGNLIARSEVARLRGETGPNPQYGQRRAARAAQRAAPSWSRGGQQGSKPRLHGNRAPCIETD